MAKPLLLIFLKHKYDFWQINDRQVQMIKDGAPDFDVKAIYSFEEASELIKDASIYYGWKFAERWVPIAKNLKWIHTPSAGRDYIDSEALRNSNIDFTNTAGFHGRFMAQHAMGMLLYFARGFKASQNEFWPRDQMANEYFDLINEEMLIVGCGAIGENLAKLASAFEIKVNGYKRNPVENTDYINYVKEAEFDNYLENSKFIVNLLPHTESTHQFFNKNIFDKFGEGKVFLNLGRGKTVDEIALLNAINEGKVSHAGIDVIYEEPPEETIELFNHPNVLITPHDSAFSKYYLDGAISDLIRRLQERKQEFV